MDKKTKAANRIFYILVILLILASAGVAFVKIFIQKDYQILAKTSCDPQTEKCFVRVCDPESDTTCPTVEADRTSYYKKISKKAATIALCDATAEKVGCGAELTCTQGEVSCSYTFCDKTTVGVDEVCKE
ncbi:hypothetical protein EPO17_01805 [Patescibacteria group bacterium]|nr:MAG: hypothetical protein EPO17_01805 [Patescibacteria group bacterium]